MPVYEGQTAAERVFAELQTDAATLHDSIRQHLERNFAPDARKHLRTFSYGEAAEFLGLAPGHLRKLHAEAKAPMCRSTAFASNRVLSARSDGVEERTLRRRLNHLVTCGLVAHRSSPNGKRYQVRDGDNACLLAFVIDLAPLRALLGHLEALAAECRQDDLLIRDRLHQHRFRTYGSCNNCSGIKRSSAAHMGKGGTAGKDAWSRHRP